MDFERINEEEILKKLHQHIPGSAPSNAPDNIVQIPDRFNDGIFHALSSLQKVKDPSYLPQDTSLRFFKRIIQRLIRPFTRGQIEFNRITMDILNGLAGNIQQFLYLYQSNIEHLQSNLGKQSQLTNDLTNKLIEMDKDRIALLTQLNNDLNLLHKRIEDEKNSLYSTLESLSKNLQQQISTEIDANNRDIQKEWNESLNLIHKRIEDEKTSIYSVLESIRQNLQQQITTEKESIHDRLSHVTMSMHQRIDDEKKSIYEIMDQGFRDARHHSVQLVEPVNNDLRALESRFNPSEIFRLYQEQNNITDDIYFELEKNFRGTDEFVKERQDFYRKLLSSHHKELKKKDGYYLDVGCGRGELLKLLKDNNIPAQGIDISQQMVEKCQEMDLTVYKEDAISFLKKLPDSELRGVIALQVIEHISIKSLFEMLYLIYQKLKPGGILILETINPESVYALRWFYIDYTHNKPLPAPLVQFFIYMAGFPQAEIILRSPVEGWKQMAPTGEQEIVDQNFHKLNNFLFGYQDYAIKAIK